MIHNFEHPYLIVTGKELAALREAAGDNVGLRQVISVCCVPRTGTYPWGSPRAARQRRQQRPRPAGPTARNLGLAYQLQPSGAVRQSRRNILPLTPTTTRPILLTTYGGRVTFQTLNESGWLIDIAWAYDLIYSFTPEERKT